MKSFKISSLNHGKRADIFITAKFPQFSRSALSVLFDAGSVSVNGVVIKTGKKLKLGDKLKVDDSPLKRQPETIDLPVIYEDDDVTVIEKPAGVLTHSKGAINDEATVASSIKPKITDKNLGGNRAGIVHRLDRVTSGIIITAKTAKAQTWLQKQFSSRNVKKNYMAVVEGIAEPPAAIIDVPIKRNPKKPQTFMAATGGKPAQTKYNTLETFEKGRQNYSLLELEPITGRTHQIRVHLAYAGHPIVGDKVYGHGKNDEILLHAASLEVTLPSKTRQVFASPLPKRFKEFRDL